MAIGATDSAEHRALKRALEGLYEVFARSGLVPVLASDEPRLYAVSGPIREISSKALNEFALELGSSVGDANDVRCLLPRLFELVVDGEAWLLGASWALAKLTLGDWSRWPVDEQAAVRAFLVALFDRAAAGWFIGVVDVAEGLVKVGEPLGLYLARIERRRDAAAVRALHWLAQAEADQVLGGKAARLEPLRAWLHAPERLVWAVQRQKELGDEVAELIHALQVLA